MNFYGDYHTHTINGKRKFVPGKHATGTLEDNVRSAAEKGLKEIGITDHGFNHKLFRTHRETVKRLKQEAIELSQKYNINVLIGVEANLISTDGTIDVLPSDMEYLDYIICGFHRVVTSKSIKDKLTMFFPNFILRVLGLAHLLRKKNTQAYINMLRKNKIDILVHPNVTPFPFLIDVVTVAKVAKEVGTYIEINCKGMKLKPHEIKELVELGVSFVVDSDAHKPANIAKFAVGEKVILDNNIPEALVGNLNKFPDFLNYKRNK